MAVRVGPCRYSSSRKQACCLLCFTELNCSLGLQFWSGSLGLGWPGLHLVSLTQKSAFYSSSRRKKKKKNKRASREC